MANPNKWDAVTADKTGKPLLSTRQATIADPAACAAMTATLSGVDTGTDMTAAQAATIVADLLALKTAVDANNAAIDSLIAALDAHGLTADA